MLVLKFRKHWTNSSSLCAATTVRMVFQNCSLLGGRGERKTVCNNQDLKRDFPDEKYAVYETFWEKTFWCWYFWVHSVDVCRMSEIGKKRCVKKMFRYIPGIWARLWVILISFSSWTGEFLVFRCCFLVPDRNM